MAEGFGAAESAAVALVRGLNAPTMSIGQLVANAQRAIGMYQQRHILSRASELHDEQHAVPLIASARILHSVASFNEKLDDSEEGSRRRGALLLLGACAHAMYGNFASAHAVVRSLESRFETFSEGEWLAAAISSPSLLGLALRSPNLGVEARAFLEDVNLLLQTGVFTPSESLISKFERLMSVPRRNTEIVLLRSARLALEQLKDLSVARLWVDRAFPASRGFIEGLLSDQKFALLPSQMPVLCSGALWKDNGNCLVTLPTSAGKTLIAEFALTFALSQGPGICFYIVPYIALGNQVVQSLRRHVPREMRVHALFGGFRGSGQLDPSTRREIVVATPERFDAILRSLAPYDYTRLVVVDELHLIEGGTRGARIEGLISRLLLMQDAGANFRLICLSAVLSNSQALCEWLRVSEDMLFTNPWRPTARRVGIWLQQGELSPNFGDGLKDQAAA